MAEIPPFRVTICGIAELRDHAAFGATHVLSILDPDYPEPEVFGQYGEHARLERRFHDIIDPTPGMILPDKADVAAILAFGRLLQAEPPPVTLLVHCHAGISRSTAAMALILAQAMPDRSAVDILTLVHSIREKAWPNLRLMELGDQILGRQGSLVEAAFALYHLQIEKRPHLAEFMEKDGRGREVAGGLAYEPL